MKKVTGQAVAARVAGRLFHPRNWRPFLRCLCRRKATRKAADDAQLKLYGQILPEGFLNYGYSDDPTIAPEKMCLDAVQRAQVRYGTRLVDMVCDRESPVLDAGCGMGGLIRLLIERGCSPTALTPNRTQIQRIRTDFPQVPVIEGKLEQIPIDASRQRFGTVITSESFQYMKLDPAIDVIGTILRPGGRWILCDYFRTQTDARKSGHLWSDFTAALDRHGWRIVSQENITAHVLPTIAFVHMWGRRLGLPLAQFAAERLERKRPALHYLFQDVLGDLRGRLQDHLDLVDPAVFAREKKYMTLLIERRAAGNGAPAS